MMGTTTIIPKMIRTLIEDGKIFPIMRVQAVSTEYVVYTPFEDGHKFDDKVFVIWQPTDGPYEWLKEWGNREHEVWTFPIEKRSADDRLAQWRAQDEAQLFALRKAQDDVLTEIIN